jgi:RNA polymerase sigma factor (sigma-70 family)
VSENDSDANVRMRRLIREYGPLLARAAWGYADNAEDHDDLMQEILLAVWRALPRFREEASERTFVLRIAHNRGVTFSISRKRLETIAEVDDVPDPTPSAEAQLIREQQHERLGDAIRTLNESQRQVIMLQLEGLSLRDIGDIQGISESNAGARLTRARAALRTLLGGAKE